MEAAAILMIAGATSALGQQTQPATETVNLQLPANEVLLDLVVRDKRNKPVLDLQPNQISVTDNGVSVPLTQLHMMSGKQQDAPLITLLFNRPGIEGPGKTSNEIRLDTSGAPGLQTSRRLRETAAKFLKTFPGSGFQFSVMDVWGRLQLQQEFTTDRKAIDEAIKSAAQPTQYGTSVIANPTEVRLAKVAQTGLDSSGTAVNTQERALARSINTALQESGRISKDAHMPTGLACLLALVESEQTLKGRKAVVYFTSSSDLSGDSHSASGKDTRAKEMVQSIIGAANRAGVSIYILRMDELNTSRELASALEAFAAMNTGSNQSGVVNGPTTSVSSSGVVTTTSTFQQMVAGQYGSQTQFRRIDSMTNAGKPVDDTLASLAKGTGGTAIDATENLSGPVKELVRDLTTYYEASYVPPTGNDDGSFHATVVKPLRAGLKVRTRTGYLALPPNAGIGAVSQPFELPLMALLRRSELPAEVKYKASVLRMGHEAEGNVNVLAVEAPLASLEIHEDTSTHLDSAHVSIMANIKDNSGVVIEHFSEDIPHRWATKDHVADSEVIFFERSFIAPPGSYVLETVILDNNSGKSAARRQPFEIVRSSALPEISELVLVRKTELADDQENKSEPLLYGNQRVEPNLFGELPSGASDVSIFFLAHTDPQSQEEATITLQVLRDGVPLGGAPMITKLKAGAEVYPYLRSFSIKSAADGQYEVKAILSQGGKSTEGSGVFTLTGAQPKNVELASNDEKTGGGPALLLADPPKLAVSSQPADGPGVEELNRILSDARSNAIAYGDSLPNLICKQTTNRYFDAHGKSNWTLKDTIVELLTYFDHEESRTVLGGERNGGKIDATQENVTGILSAGEFGEALGGIFKPSAKADFQWKESGKLAGEPVEIFEYRIELKNSSFALRSGPDKSTMAGYHGRIFIDRATHGVRSITMITDEVPPKFPIRKVAVRVDYDYVAINSHDYLFPISGEILVGRGGSMVERNDVEFSDFRRFGSTTRILDSPQ
jgi:VWFA-related protein